MPRGMTPAEFRRLAALGARARIAEMQDEVARIRNQFPELTGSHETPTSTAAPVRKRRRRMSTAARKAVSTRMRAYWTARRKAKGAKG